MAYQEEPIVTDEPQEIPAEELEHMGKGEEEGAAE